MKKKKKLVTILLYIFLLAFILASFVIYYFNKLLGPSLIKSASITVEKITSVIVSNCVKKYLIDGGSVINLVEIIRGDDGKVEFVRYDTSNVNKISMDISDLVLEDINYLALGEFEKIDFVLPNITEKYYKEISDGIVFGISIGNIFNNNFLANIGPRIPLKMNLNGNVDVEIKNKITEYGMNNALMEIYIEVRVRPVIVMPFLSKEIDIVNRIPLVTEIIQGEIPEGYFSGNVS